MIHITKFEELCRIYAAVKERRDRNATSCYEFANLLVRAMIDDFQCTERQVSFIPIDPDFYASAAEETMWLESDGFWHLRVKLTLNQKSSDSLQPMFSLRFLIKQVNHHFVVKFETPRKEFTIHKDKPDEFRPLFELVFERIKERLEGLEKALQKEWEPDETGRVVFDV